MRIPVAPIRSPLPEEDGATLVETALVLPIIFLLTFGFMEICLIFLGISCANFGSREALRYASVHSNTSSSPATTQQLTAIVKSYILPYPSYTFSLTEQFYNISAETPAQGQTNYVGLGVAIIVSITYQFTVMGHTYDPISYSSSDGSIIVN